ncbi:thioredoxin family protein [Nocardia sp. NPDC023852]|uniref:thioredoxin family protein n=1 Tax=Nocardia sp. NPDC023852 TaxID=3154697 RepID=UPI0033D7366B
MYLSDRDVFGLDFRNGEPRRHYTVNVPSKATVMDAFLSYFDGDNRWRTMVEWERDSHYEQIQRRPEQFAHDSNDELPAGPGLRLVVFSTDASPGSQVLQRQLADLERETGDRVDIEVVDIELAPRIAAAWGVSASDLPVQVIFDDGILQHVVLGTRSARDLISELSPPERPLTA